MTMRWSFFLPLPDGPFAHKSAHPLSEVGSIGKLEDESSNRLCFKDAFLTHVAMLSGSNVVLQTADR
ncbi:unnamed protein product [Protopolystoma xenopodis]|uniref:Uncharacterized protein n=1 Tax=Protopolystoma xenopodis TaxID=117903 RepID=A0A3S5A7N5_9PLAT|nr:unnamed protein product [Protopolystoma xenopodis]